MNEKDQGRPYDGDMAGRPSSKKPTANGARLAALRQAAGLSQVEVGKALGIPQRTVSFYEREAEAIPSNLVPALADILGVSVGEVLGVEDGARRRGPKSKLERQLERVKELPRGEQQYVSKFLEQVLSKRPN